MQGFIVKFLCVLAIGFFIVDSASARPYKLHAIHSKILDEKVELHIQLPLFYKENSALRYPVLYVLGAPEGLSLTSGILDPLVGYNNAPQMIIVGLQSSDRDRDFTPSSKIKYEPTNGGAARYLDFLSEEILPYVEKQFRTEDFRILSGHSYGGLFVAYSFYKKPTLFQGNFAFSPSLFWDDGRIAAELISFIENNPNNNRFLYMNIGNEGLPETNSKEGQAMYQNILAIEKAAQKHKNRGLDFTFERFFDQPHQVTQIFGTVGALRHHYPKWAIPHPVHLKGFDEVFDHFHDLSKKYGYKIEPKVWQSNDEGIFQLWEQGNPTQAIKYFAYSLSKEPHSISALENIAEAYIQLNKFQEARQYLTSLLSLTHLSEAERQKYTDKLKAVSSEP